MPTALFPLHTLLRIVHAAAGGIADRTAIPFCGRRLSVFNFFVGQKTCSQGFPHVKAGMDLKPFHMNFTVHCKEGEDGFIPAFFILPNGHSGLGINIFRKAETRMTMAKQNFYADSFAAAFAREGTFLAFLTEREASAAWETRHAKDLRIEALDGKTTVLAPPPGMRVTEGKAIIEDTMENTRLLLKAKDLVYPVRGCAVMSLLKRSKINGTALNKVEKPVLARILNHCLKVAAGDALLRIADGKISAVHAGDRNDYAILEMPELFSRTAEYLETEFPGRTFAGGSFEHSMVTAVWELSGETGLVKAYQSALTLHGVEYGEIKPAVRLTSSDAAFRGANLYPTLFTGKRGGSVTLGNPLKLEHRDGADMKDFDAQLKLLCSQYQLAIGKLTKLLDIEISNPVNCLLRICKHIGISKKPSYEAAEQFKALNGEAPCTAHDVYFGINEVVFMLQCEGASGSKVIRMEENVARALSVRWSDFDIPCDFKW